MKTSLDCVPCFIRQTLDAVRMISEDTGVHEAIVREVLEWTSKMEFSNSPPDMAQRIHRRLRKITGEDDPYREIKHGHNLLALRLLPEMQKKIGAAEDPLILAVRLAIAGNVIDMGVSGSVDEEAIFREVDKALSEAFTGDSEEFRKAVEESREILYLADNAGEIVFDRLLIEQLPTSKVVLAVRGLPVLNDAVRRDAETAGLNRMVRIVDNGSDAPATILEECSPEFRELYEDADMIIAKGQGNFESLSSRRENIFFLLKAKCPVIAEHLGLPVGTHVASRFSADRL